MSKVILLARKKVGELLPDFLRSYILRRVSLLDSRTQWWKSKDVYRNDLPYSTYESPYPVKLGILKEFWHRHTHYISACREMKVAYEVIDITAADWLERVEVCNCDALLVNPSVQLSLWKQMFDEKLEILEKDMGKLIYPSYKELWLYESKRRMAYWFEGNNIPHAKTRVFYNRDEALEFLSAADYPIVAKTDMGARASGVRILGNKSKAIKYVKKAFKKGILHGDAEAKDADWKFVIFQEYIESEIEWRMICIGGKFFGHQKLKSDDFHSGSNMIGWVKPPERLLDMVKHLCEEYSLDSVDIDIFEKQDGEYLVNEVQCIFGAFMPYQMLVDGVPGYYIYNENNAWEFIRGIVCQNACCNLRVASVLQKLGHESSLPILQEDRVLNVEHVEQSKKQTIEYYDNLNRN